MVIFCSADEFDSLCRDIAHKADVLRFQAKGGSMFPFIRSGDWVDAALCNRGAWDIGKGDIILFRKDKSLYLHRVLRKAGDGFFIKGDMSFGHDGVIPGADILARAISIHRGSRSIDLRSPSSRLLSVLAAEASFFLQYPALFFRNTAAAGMKVIALVQSLKACRRILRKISGTQTVIRPAVPEDEEQLRDLYRMAGKDVREGLVQIEREGAWLVAERNGRIVAGLTISPYEKDPGLWVIFGLEVKPLFRGMGIGRAIVKAAVSKAEGSGAARIGLFVNKKSKPALGLYRSLGFETNDIVPEGFNRSSDELYLSKRVPEPPFEWRAVLDRAVEEGVFYPLYRNLFFPDAKDTVIPQGIYEKFKQMYYLHISKSSDFNSRVERILGYIESRKIRVLLFKGPAIDSFIYDDFLRPRLDLDIVVRDEDMPALETALYDLGYTLPRQNEDYPIPEYLNSRLFIPPADDLIPVHVHKHLINNMFLTVDNILSTDMAKIWDETEPYKEYRYIYMLKPELNIVYLCEHGLKHSFSQMIFLYEIERLIGYYGEGFDWKKFIRLAEGFGLGRQAYYGLYFVQELLSRCIPQAVMDVLMPERFTTGEKVFIKNILHLKRSRYASYPVYCAMRSYFIKKIYFIFRTAFPPKFTFRGYVTRMRRLILP